MRLAFLAVVLAPSLSIVACVGDSPTTPPADAGSDTTTVDSSIDVGADGSSDATVATDADAGPTLKVLGLLKLWFRSDVSLKKTAAGVVWADQSPLKLDAIASLDAGTSGYPNNKQNYFPNGQPGIEFAVDPELLRLVDTNEFTDLSNGLSIFVVATPTASTAGQWISFGASTSSNRVTLGQNGNVVQVALGTTVYTGSGPNAQVPLNEHHLYEAVIKPIGGADSIAYYRDGQAAGTSNGSTLQNAARALSTIGGTQTGNTINTSRVVFGEILVYGKVVTPGERADIEAYLKARFATP